MLLRSMMSLLMLLYLIMVVVDRPFVRVMFQDGVFRNVHLIFSRAGILSLMVQPSLMLVMTASTMLALEMFVMMTTMTMTVPLLSDQLFADLVSSMSSRITMMSSMGLRSLGRSRDDLVSYRLLCVMLLGLILDARHVAWALTMSPSLRLVNVAMLRQMF